MVTLGHIYDQSQWRYSASNSRHPGLFEAIQFFAENHLQLPTVVGARLGKAIKVYPTVRGYTGAVIACWKPQWGYLQFHDQPVNGEGIVASFSLSRIYEDWRNIRSLQLLFGEVETIGVSKEHCNANVPPSEASLASPRQTESSSLSPIPEDSQEDFKPGQSGQLSCQR